MLMQREIARRSAVKRRQDILLRRNGILNVLLKPFGE